MLLPQLWYTLQVSSIHPTRSVRHEHIQYTLTFTAYFMALHTLNNKIVIQISWTCNVLVKKVSMATVFNPARPCLKDFHGSKLCFPLLTSCSRGNPPGPIPVGYRFKAQSTSDTTNQIPVNGAPDAEGDYRKLLGELEEYLTSGGQSHDLPPLFAKVSLGGSEATTDEFT